MMGFEFACAWGSLAIASDHFITNQDYTKLEHTMTWFLRLSLANNPTVSNLLFSFASHFHNPVAWATVPPFQTLLVAVANVLGRWQFCRQREYNDGENGHKFFPGTQALKICRYFSSVAPEKVASTFPVNALNAVIYPAESRYRRNFPFKNSFCDKFWSLLTPLY